MNAATNWLNMLSTPLEPIKTSKATSGHGIVRGPRPTVKPIGHKQRIGNRVCHQSYCQAAHPSDADVIERLRDEASMSQKIAENFLAKYKTDNNI